MSAGDAKAIASDTTFESTRSSKQLQARLRIRDDAYRMRASQQVGDRFRWAAFGVVGCVLAIALGILSLAMAPKGKADTAAIGLVTLTISGGQSEVACGASTVIAMVVGGTKDEPVLVTLPASACPSQAVTLKKGQKSISVKAIEPSEIAPSPSPK